MAFDNVAEALDLRPQFLHFSRQSDQGFAAHKTIADSSATGYGHEPVPPKRQGSIGYPYAVFTAFRGEAQPAKNIGAGHAAIAQRLSVKILSDRVRKALENGRIGAG